MEPLPTPLAHFQPAPALPQPPRPPPFFGCFFLWCLLEDCIPTSPHDDVGEFEHDHPTTTFTPAALAAPQPPPFRRRSRGAASNGRRLPSWAKPSALVLRRGLSSGGGSVSGSGSGSGGADGSGGSGGGGGGGGGNVGIRLERVDVGDVVPGK